MQVHDLLDQQEAYQLPALLSTKRQRQTRRKSGSKHPRPYPRGLHQMQWVLLIYLLIFSHIYPQYKYTLIYTSIHKYQYLESHFQITNFHRWSSTLLSYSNFKLNVLFLIILYIFIKNLNYEHTVIDMVMLLAIEIF